MAGTDSPTQSQSLIAPTSPVTNSNPSSPPSFARPTHHLNPPPSFNSLLEKGHTPRTSSTTAFSTASSFYDASPYAGSRVTSIADKFTLPPDPRLWGSDLFPESKEADDQLHAPLQPIPRSNTSKWGLGLALGALGASTEQEDDRGSGCLNRRGFLNLGCLILLISAIITLFAGYPIITYATKQELSTFGAYNIGGINASGQIPEIPGNRGLIDADTPQDAYTKTSWNGQGEMELVFSDEFNVDGRTFYPGDDPYWEAVDLWYWGTNDMEWYDPAAITTANGSLVITLQQKETHDLHYQGGMMTTWNKFCFTGGYVEASVELPGLSDVSGLWPALWTMGNLGRAGYGASLEGMWPYTYDACDIGTVANQSINGSPYAATVNGDTGKGGVLSYLPGQRLSRCTCEGEDHPGPKHSDGSFVGRSAPEIDVFEAQIGSDPIVGQVSQSAQWAPFDPAYAWDNSTANEVIVDPSLSKQNTFSGSATQEAASVVTNIDQECYEYEGGCYSIYGMEYKPGFDDAYISWVADNKLAWTFNVAGVGANSETEISARPVPQEPMYLITNLGMSKNFATVDLANLPFPVHMRIDYIRVYQPKGKTNVGCDPKEFPTEKYINEHIEAYTNPNLTTWVGDYGQEMPKNSFLGQC